MKPVNPNVADLSNLKRRDVRERIDKTIGDKIRTRRTTLGVTQMELGKALGMSFQQIQKYERGSNRVAASRIVQLAAALKVTPGWFFEGLDTPAPETLLPRRACIEASRLMQSVDPKAQNEILGVVRRIVQSLPRKTAA